MEADVLDLTSGDREKAEQNQVTESEQVSTNKQPEKLTLDLMANKDKDGQIEDDAVSNKSLDLNFASKLMDFKLSPNEQANSNSCEICGKNFKFPATLGRHMKVHSCESNDQEQSVEHVHMDQSTPTCDPVNQDLPNETIDQEEELPVDLKISRSPVESERSEQQNVDGEEVSDEKEKSLDKNDDNKECKTETKGTKADKRKKICTVCSKRFWSLQDLTRHMRSHTG